MNDSRILVIDDEATICALLEAILQVAGFSVDKAMTVTEGLGFLGQGNYSLVITDQYLPDGEGLDIVRRAQGIVQKILMMTSNKDEALTAAALAAGAVDVMDKPFEDIDVLIDRVQRLCA